VLCVGSSDTKLGTASFHNTSLLVRYRHQHSQHRHHGPDRHRPRAPQAIQQGFREVGQEMHQARQKRVLKDCNCHSHWLCTNGIHRIFRETHPHPHQQHHRGGLEEAPCHQIGDDILLQLCYLDVQTISYK